MLIVISSGSFWMLYGQTLGVYPIIKRDLLIFCVSFARLGHLFIPRNCNFNHKCFTYFSFKNTGSVYTTQANVFRLLRSHLD